ANYKSDVVKITEGKLYRVSGQTAQLKGVVPDINLPDIFDAMKYREKFSPDALPSDTVKRNAYYKPLPSLPISGLSQSSEQRVMNNKSFRDIKMAIQSQDAISRGQTVLLKPDAFETWIQQVKNLKKIVESENEYHSTVYTAQSYSSTKDKS